MKSSDSLFKLIKSLTIAEKGYFKKYTAKHVIGEKNDYTILFEAIDALEEYDEELLLKKLSAESFVHRISAVKNYLNKLVLESMRAFHSEATVERELLETLADISFLWRRNLRDQAEKVVKRALKKALQYEEFELALKIITWAEHVYSDSRGISFNEKMLSEIKEEKQAVIDKINNIKEINDISSVLGSYMSAGVMHEKKIPEEVHVLLELPVMQSEDCALSFYAKMQYNHIYILYNTYFDFKPDLGLQYAFRRYELVSENMHLSREKPKNYITTVQQYVQRCIFQKQFDKVVPVMNDLRLFIQSLNGPQYESSRSEGVFSIVNLEAIYILNSARFKDGADKLSGWESMILPYRETIGESLLRPLYFNIALVAMAADVPKKALHFLNRSLEFPLEIRQDIVSAARLAELLVHFDMGNLRWVEYSTRSLYRYFVTRGRLGKIEKIVVKFLRKLTDIRNSKEQLKLFTSIYNEMIKAQATQNQPFTDMISFDSWLKAKITGKTFGETLGEKIQSEM